MDLFAGEGFLKGLQVDSRQIWQLEVSFFYTAAAFFIYLKEVLAQSSKEAVKGQKGGMSLLVVPPLLVFHAVLQVASKCGCWCFHGFI